MSSTSKRYGLSLWLDLFFERIVRAVTAIESADSLFVSVVEQAGLPAVVFDQMGVGAGFVDVFGGDLQVVVAQFLVTHVVSFSLSFTGHG